MLDFEACRYKSFREFSRLRRAGEFCDIELHTSDGHQLACHKIVLVSCSSYFKIVLSGGADKFQCSGGPLKIDVNRPTLEILISACYGEKVNIDDSQILVLLEVSHRLGMEPVFEILCQAMSAPLCYTLLKADQFFGSKALYGKCVQVASEDFEEFIDSDEFLQTPSHILLKIINKITGCECEEMILSAVLKWAHVHQFPASFVAMIANIRFELMNIFSLYYLKKNFVETLPEEFREVFESLLFKGIQCHAQNIQAPRRSGYKVWKVGHGCNPIPGRMIDSTFSTSTISTRVFDISCGSRIRFEDELIILDTPKDRIAFPLPKNIRNRIRVTGICFHQPTESVFIGDSTLRRILRIELKSKEIAHDFFSGCLQPLVGEVNVCMGTDGFLYCIDSGTRILRFNPNEHEGPVLFKKKRSVSLNNVSVDSEGNCCSISINSCCLTIEGEEIHFESDRNSMNGKIFFEEDGMLLGDNNGNFYKTYFKELLGPNFPLSTSL